MAALTVQRECNGMAKITSIHKAREKRTSKTPTELRYDGFHPCSPDMTICGDCTDNRSRNKCPRLKEWLAKEKG